MKWQVVKDKIVIDKLQENKMPKYIISTDGKLIDAETNRTISANKVSVE